MVQATKFYLIFQETEALPYKNFCEIMTDIQKDVLRFKNRASSRYFAHMQAQAEWKEKHGEWPKDKELLDGGNIRNLLYHMATEMIPNLQTANTSSISEDVCKYFNSHRKDIFGGKQTIPSYKWGQPILLHNKSIKVWEEAGEIYLTLSLFSKRGCVKYGLASGRVDFKVYHKCGSSRAILERCLTGEYSIGASGLKYDKRKKKYEFSLTYKFEGERAEGLDPEKIVGINLGVVFPLVAYSADNGRRMIFNGDELNAFRSRTEAMKRDLCRTRAQAGDGSVGHGRNKRMAPADRIRNRIANFRDTKNHAWSRELVNFAARNRCGTIQMEDLTGITDEDSPKFLRDWSYFDLQTKIMYKAQAAGINVVKINPRYTSQRCSVCGFVCAENRKTRADFECLNCGYKGLSDLNAAKNIAMKGIAETITEGLEKSKNKEIKSKEDKNTWKQD